MAYQSGIKPQDERSYTFISYSCILQPPGSDYAQLVGIYARMVLDRILFIGNFIDEENANSIISSILYLRKEDSTGPITLYLNVPGALLRPGLAVYDLLRQIGKDCEITTVNIGLCTGMGALPDGRYWIALTFSEDRRFGPLAIGRTSRTGRRFEVRSGRP